MAPEIVAKSNGALYCDEENAEIPDVLCVVWLQDETQKVFLTARDQDGDDLEFYWWGTGSGPFEGANTFPTGDRMTSEIEITPADVIDGEELKCTVSDGSPDETTWTWSVVVQE